MRRTVWILAVVGALVVTLTPGAAAQVALPDAEDAVGGTVDTVTSTVDAVASTADVGDTVDGTVDTVASTADVGGTVDGTVDTVTSTGGQAAETVQGAAGGVTGSSGTSGATSGGTSGALAGIAGVTSSGSGSGGSAASSGTTGGLSAQSRSGEGRNAKARSRSSRQRTKFDRLPPRLERLLERIEFGRNTRANLRRLEHLLASASPELRARVLRLLRGEIRRLRADGITAAERSRIKRLRRAERMLTALMRQMEAPPGTTAAGSPLGTSSAGATLGTTAAGSSLGGSASPQGAGDARPARAGAGGVLGSQAGNGDDGALAFPFPTPGLPDRPQDFPLAFGLILFALAVLGFAGVVAGVTRHVLRNVRSS
ncbi:MAG: hypothetical protein ACRDOS_02875 [Gaiellaceae bacterium]